jgi:hypothetical protein
MVCGTEHGNHLRSRRLFSRYRENNHGTKVFKESIDRRQARDEEAQGGYVEERTFRPQGQKPQAGDRDWSVRGKGEGQEGAEESFEEAQDIEETEGVEEAQGEEVAYHW